MKYIYLISILFLFSCSSKKQINEADLTGSWFFIDAGSYYELHLDNEHALLHNELIGSKISKYKLSDSNKIQLIIDGKLTEEYTILGLSGKVATMVIQSRSQELNRLDQNLNLKAILDGETEDYRDFTKHFRKREDQYLNQTSL